jgi:hypothetical protein
MNRRTLISTAAAVVGGIVLAVAQNGCDSQPPIRCMMQTSLVNDAVARFTPVGMPTPVPGAPAMACDNAIQGQELPTYPPVTAANQSGPDPLQLRLGFETFSPSPLDSNLPSEPNTLAIKAEWIGDRIQDAQANAAFSPNLSDSARAAMAIYPYTSMNPAPPLPPDQPENTNRPYAFGKFDSTYPNADGVCTATLTPSEMDYPEVPLHQVFVAIPGDGSYVSPNADNTPGVQSSVSSTHVRYEWTNFRAVVSTQSLGVEAFAHVKITRDGCAAEYDVSMLSPRVTCTVVDPVTGNPVTPAMGDQTLCTATASASNPYGSGLTPGIPVSCEETGSDTQNPDFECLPTRKSPQ